MLPHEGFRKTRRHETKRIEYFVKAFSESE
jgi:hypothetical protein